MRSNVLLGLLLLAIFAIAAVHGVTADDDDDDDEGKEEAHTKKAPTSTWDSFVSNVLAYAIVVAPAALVVRYLKNNEQIAAGSGAAKGALRLCIFGDDPDDDDVEKGETQSPGDLLAEESFGTRAFQLALCVGGLQGSYLTWGVLQEKIMTTSYGTDEFGDDIHFTNSQFLVFINRVLALLVAFIITRMTVQPKQTAPLYKYSFASMSNVMSSWCQYEALRYVSFPTQVLAKASKIIPVMLMGKVVQGKTYPAFEYGCAVLLSVGVSMFMFSRAEEKGKLDDDDQETSFAGLFLLLGYMLFDSFTSNFQAGLFKSHKMTSYQMMFGVNLFSCFFTLWSLIQAGTFMSCVQFTLDHPDFMWQGIILSICSATGQIFIFRTLSLYGALIFAIIMTTRQVISIFLSALLFGHTFAAKGWLGIFVVFIAMFGRIYLKNRKK